MLLGKLIKNGYRPKKERRVIKKDTRTEIVNDIKSEKNRRTGKTGLMGYLAYDESTAILSEVEPDAFEDVTEF